MTIDPHQTTVPAVELATRRAEPSAVGQPRRAAAAATPGSEASASDPASSDAAQAADAAAEKSASAAAFPLQQLSIRHDPEIGRFVVQVLDAQTGDLVRQIPSEEWVQVLKRLRGAKGLFVDRTE